VYGHGLVNAYRAVLAVGSAPPLVDPQLSLSPTSLNFGTNRSTMDVAIDNLGGGQLVMGPVTEVTSSGGDWLSTELVGAADASRTAHTLRVRVNRFGVLSGNYQGVVTVASNGGTLEIPVVMGVVSVPTPPPYLDIHIQVISAETGQVAARTAVNPAASLEYSIPVVPIGRYIVVAGTDLDGDGTLCEDGDYCGAWPLLGEPATVEVIQGLESTGVDFQVELPATVGR
jgi:serine protease